MSKNLMLVFFGTSHHSAKFLELILQRGLKPDLVVSAPPKPTGKKQALTENPTATAAKKLSLPFITSLNELPQTMKQFNNVTIGLILDFNKIIPNKIISLFPKGIINIHFSKLPQYRGPAPVQYTILNGDREAWITYYLIVETVDSGKILAQTSLPLDLIENTETLYQKLITKAASEITQIIDGYLCDRYHTCQQEGTPSYTKKLTADRCRIDWTKSPEKIERLIRAAYPEPGAWIEVSLHGNATMKQCNNKTIDNSPLEIRRLKVLKAHVDQGKLILDLVQLEGKNPVTWKQFREGYPSASFL